MFAKLMIICAVVAAALAQAREYPAGVHPAVCPNYPYCAPDALARHTPDGMPIPQWSYPYAAAPVAPAAPVAEYVSNTVPDALARHIPDGMPIPQWSYPYAAAPVAPAAPVADQGGARYPASFNPALCPNYPYCW